LDEGDAMKIVAIIINIFIPGLGTLFVGKVAQGIVQLLLAAVAFVLTASGIFAIFGVPLGFCVWIWALVSAATSPSEPVKVVIVHQYEPAPAPSEKR
jgi:TM2 domain-containing membrane protein YozV